MNLIISDDNYVFVDVTDNSRSLLKAIPLYAMHGDGTYGLIESEQELELAIDLMLPIAIKGGELPKLDVPFHNAPKVKVDGMWYVELSFLLKNYALYI